jgi:predicted  nucleic acid-binding Zn-ribbon protein
VLDTVEAVLGDLRLAQAALTAVQANVFIADPQLKLVYMNPKAAATLRGLAKDVQRAFGVEYGQVLGGSIHRFHKDPQRVERILRTPGQLPHDAAFTFGDITLDTHINQITAPDGSVAGYVVAWEDISAKKASEQKARALADRLSETQEVSATMQAVATATEEMAATAKEIARNATEATTTVTNAVGVVDSANRTMTELGGASEQISEVVKAISTVAEQTNLLALNATIEAARAGESGKGFAVVAGEVKELSRQTKDATERINQMISSVQQLSRAAIEAIAGIAQVMEHVSQNQASIASAVEQQTATTQEISKNVADAARRAEEIATFVAGHH